MQFPETPAIDNQVTNPSTGAIYKWDGSMWVNVPPEGGGELSEEDRAALIADQERQDQVQATETENRRQADGLLQSQITSVEDQVNALEVYDDGPVKEDLVQLQEGFDAAVIAAQEGAESLTLDLQSYAKKEDIPDLVEYAKKEDIPDLNGYAKKEDVPDLNEFVPAPRLPGYSWNYIDYPSSFMAGEGETRGSAPIGEGEFAFNPTNNTFYISGITASKLVIATQSSSFSQYSIQVAMSIYDEEGGGGLCAFIKAGSIQLQSYAGQDFFRVVRAGYAKQVLRAGNAYSITLGGVF